MHPSPHLLELANAAADVLIETAITARGRSTWVGATLGGPRGLHDQGVGAVHGTGDVTLYQGAAGIAWACMHAAKELGRPELVELAASAVRGALGSVQSLAGTGLYDGVAGVGLVSFLVGETIDDGGLRREGLRLLEISASHPPAGADLVSGAAGIVVGLLSAARVAKSDRFVDAASVLGQHLLDTADVEPWGWSWAPPAMDGPGLCGLAHGSAGVAWALAELLAMSEDDHRVSAQRLLTAIEGALRYERSWYDGSHNNWPDLRSMPTAPGAPTPFPSWWCHGAAGIGLSRLRLHQLRPHPRLVAEAATALQACFASGVEALDDADARSAGLTLCHGISRTIELLLAANEILGEQEHLIAARWLLDQLVQRLGPDIERWPSGVPGDTWSASLMVGLAGAVILLLRASQPGCLPSVGLLGVDLTSTIRASLRPEPTASGQA